MNTFWLKIAMVVFLVLGVIVLITVLTSGPPEPEKPEKTFYDQAEQDKEKFLAEPEALDTPDEPTVATPGPASSKTDGVEPVQPNPKPAEPEEEKSEA